MRRKETEQVPIEDLKEATSIIIIQNELTSFFEKMKMKFISHGEPFPWMPKTKEIKK